MISFDVGSTFSQVNPLAVGVDFFSANSSLATGVNASSFPQVAGVSTAAAYSLNGVLFLALVLGVTLAISYFYSSLYGLMSAK